MPQRPSRLSLIARPAKLLLLMPLLAFTSAAGAAELAAPGLMPWPQQVSAQHGRLSVPASLRIEVEGADLSAAMKGWHRRLALQTGGTAPAGMVPSALVIRIQVAQDGPHIPTVAMDESYQLSVNADGVALRANSRFGAMRGMETLLQLLQPDAAGHGTLPLLQIQDAPRFRWRGLLLDSVRHFLPLEDIKRQLDGMAAAKLNVFHWHLSDDQGWRYGSLVWPRLQELASDGLFYSPAQMRDVVAYAAQRGIRVLPELGFPGHASALAVAYPDLISAAGPFRMQRQWGVHLPTLDPSKPAVYEFLDRLIGELVEIFPDQYLHIGGDEVDPTQWLASPDIRAYMATHALPDAKALQAHFNQKLEKILARHGRRMVGWDEIFHPALPRSIMVQSWRGQDSLAITLQQGYPGILSTGLYLDQPHSSAFHYRNEPLPIALDAHEQLADGERAQTWAFRMPRLKGPAVSGSFSLIQDRSGSWRGFIDFNGRARRPLRAIEWRGSDRLSFTLDTWMGEFTPSFKLTDTELTGYVLIGNVRYLTNGERMDGMPEGLAAMQVDALQAQNLWGGEAALWTENVNAQILDLKLWPRTFAVAERLWSPQKLRDEADMYRRLAAVDAWSSVSVGLQQHQQAARLMAQLAGSTQISPLQIFAEAVEAGQYYARQHTKFLKGNYDQFERLDRFADALPPESAVVRAMDAAVSRLLADSGDTAATACLADILSRWQGNAAALNALIAARPDLANLAPVAADLAELVDLGLGLLQQLTRQRPLSASQTVAAPALFERAAQLRDEVVIRAVYPLERLFNGLAASD
ncbi:beta-N-acetylhexosaminidase [Paucibacter sp. B2R-40]|uniref:beta-N-acetylhexosaminidase n=1 Tax=Paucibacter sp. B2R-40 TaxID=2893554 RepID=UPI0021E49409|nr:beta-N-acetylhexosaminidase [Paucibacter sp. B2R-40]MCV2353442.1 beta-N-acetylhexosaminidase [Paucibacter sp. B2R-40]